ncbi:hypothetical protein DFP72DRAFT_617228 [Ephemerocybe angulata]|uniref:Uncharacterized protein n=1 Tax=Ephemerocybe angulata TaxID=980116 RepID=A0A8H6M059_9AGAR|nr:hypothetical protein DFP72DRAFT_617228 [Tulosesus angulatus]
MTIHDLFSCTYLYLTVCPFLAAHTYSLGHHTYLFLVSIPSAFQFFHFMTLILPYPYELSFCRFLRSGFSPSPLHKGFPRGSPRGVVLEVGVILGRPSFHTHTYLLIVLSFVVVQESPSWHLPSSRKLTPRAVPQALKFAPRVLRFLIRSLGVFAPQIW